MLSSTGRIHLLAPGIAEQIAAGEVIERPWSVVKELVENAIDAQCTQVRIVLEEGGKNFIEVTDNGYGMVPEDLVICIQRHATSKLKQMSDLEHLSTLGFRGEALPSIAAVADLQICSRTHQCPHASQVQINSDHFFRTSAIEVKPITFGKFIDQTQHGTCVRVQGLFSQVPARLKFLKSSSSEVAQIKGWLERLALAYPQIGFELINHEQTLLSLTPENEEKRVQNLLNTADPFCIQRPPSLQDLGLQLRLYWAQGRSLPHARQLYTLVNRRAIKDRLLQQALLAPFRQLLLPGHYPAVVLFLEMQPAALDINVHPAKIEVRFLNAKKIFQILHQTLHSLLEEQKHELKTLFPQPAFTPGQMKESWQFVENKEPLHSSDITSAVASNPPLQKSLPISQNSGPNYLGVLFNNTYLLYEDQNSLILIDQHAAHEKIHYERLKNASSTASQPLLLPEVVHFDLHQDLNPSQVIHCLQPFGFELEPWGPQQWLFRALPVDWNSQHLKLRLENLLNRVQHHLQNPSQLQEALNWDQILFETLASQACHSAIRSGEPLSAIAVKSLVTDLFACQDPHHCPHGRPTFIKIPKHKIHTWFQRS